MKQTDQEKNRRWYRVDATWKTLGRLAVDVAKKLMGKDRAYYSDFWDAGSFVIVENVENGDVSDIKNARKYLVYSLILEKLYGMLLDECFLRIS